MGRFGLCTETHLTKASPKRLGRLQFLYAAILVMVCLALATPVRGDTISGTVKDPSGGVVIGTRIEITGGNLLQPLLLTSDESGKFVAPDLNAGKYSIRAAKEGFDDLVTTVDLHGTTDLALKLTITAQQTSVTVTEKSAAFANSDAVYRQLRSDGVRRSPLQSLIVLALQHVSGVPEHPDVSRRL